MKWGKFARLVGKIFADAGIVRDKNAFIETDREGLVKI
jgi:hypothetical protein